MIAHAAIHKRDGGGEAVKQLLDGTCLILFQGSLGDDLSLHRSLFQVVIGSCSRDDYLL